MTESPESEDAALSAAPFGPDVGPEALQHPLYVIADSIVEFFEGPGPTGYLMAELYHSYTCVVCGRSGRAAPDDPAAVLLTVYDTGMGPLVVHLAHPRCSPSGMVMVLGSPMPTGILEVPAMAWLRRGDPPSVVVIAPRVRVTDLSRPRNGALLDRVLAGLLSSGFQLLTAPEEPLSRMAGLVSVQISNGQRLRVTDAVGNVLYDGALPIPDGWQEMIPSTGLIGIVVVSGLDLRDPNRDHLADLHAAIRRGAAVGLAVPATTLPLTPRSQPEQPQQPPRRDCPAETPELARPSRRRLPAD